MRARVSSWGVPDIRNTVHRPSVLGAIQRSPHPVIVLSAPTGYGKTIAVAQACGTLDKTVLWLGLSGRPVNPSHIHLGLVRLLEDTVGSDPSLASEADVLPAARQAVATAAAGGRVVLILDDAATTPEWPLLRSVAEVRRALNPLVETVILTTRNLDADELLESMDTTVIGRRELLLRHEEAAELARGVVGNVDSEADTEALLQAAGGHIALFRMLILENRAERREAVAEPDVVAVAMVEQLIRSHLGEADREALEVAALLKTASTQEIQDVLGADAVVALRRSAKRLPLVSWNEGVRPGQPAVFVVHDIVADCILHRMTREGGLGDGTPFQRVMSILAARGDWTRVRLMLSTFGSTRETIAFVEEHGAEMQAALASEDLLRIIGLASLQQAMGSPRFLLNWSKALYDIGAVTESLAKANAARMLAEHFGDYETCGLALADRLSGLADQGRLQDALDDADRHLEDLLPRTSPPVRCQLLLSYAHALGGRSRVEEANVVLDRCEQEAAKDPARCRPAVERLQRYRVLISTLRTGDWSAGAQMIPQLFNQPQASYVIRETLRGNFAWCLAEIGRLSTSLSVLESLTGMGHSLLDAAFYQTQAMVLAAKGDTDSSLRVLDTAAKAASEIGDEVDFNYSLLLKAPILCGLGRPEDALEYAERAYEGLTRNDYFRYAHLAAIEVAACLVALGDSVVAVRWLPPSTENKYNEVALRTVQTVAEGRRQGKTPDLERLREMGDFIQSGSVNWRLAMYCRSLPELLGYLAQALGEDGIPLHLLRMVQPEYAERALLLARDMLPDSEWRVLGERALGEEQFLDFVERKGRPICRVRLFGGLDVSVDGRPVSEKDWKKRKARLLFAMLVVRRGQDIPRDVILDHLWPDLSEDKAKNNFYVAWSTMKSALMGPDSKEGPCPYVESRRGRCRVVRESLHSDVDAFETLLEKARTAEAENRPADTVSALQELMSVYRGDLLPGDVYDDWFSSLRDRYRFEFIDAMLRGVDLLLEKDDPFEALVFARRGLMVDPYREDLYQAALRCQILAGQRSAAIETFIQCKTQLAEELGLDPAAETLALYQQILAMEERPRYDTYGLTEE